MAVPEEIKRVPRPVNTTVYDGKRDGPKRYFVRERLGCKYIKGHCPQPQYGKVIGYIYEGKFVPKQQTLSTVQADSRSFGAAAFAYSVCDELKEELTACFDITDAYTMLAVALLRVLKPRVSNSRLNSLYERSWISAFIPGMHLSGNTVSKLLVNLGKDGNRRRQFFGRRLSKVSGLEHIAIDGTLKQDSSVVNDLSGFSYKSRLKGCRDISIIYAYDIEKNEPLCAQVFPGNCIDAGAYREFIRENKIESGIIIADKGFPPSKLAAELKEHPQLHYLTPIKRNDANISKFGLLNFEGVLTGTRQQILYCKKSAPNGKFYYSFKDTGLESSEQKDYLAHRMKECDFNNEVYRMKKEKFGLIIFESDQDLSPKTAYQCYQDRWLLELMFKKYKSYEGLVDTRVQTDYSVWGSEFVNFLSTVITSKMIKKADQAGLLDEMTYGEMIDELNHIWRKTEAKGPVRSADNYWVHPFRTGMQILEKLGLSEPVEPLEREPRAKGRPRIKPEFVGPKRPRGRPRKSLGN